MIVSFAGGRVLEATEHGKEKRLAVYMVREPSEIPGVARLGVDALSDTLTPELLGSLLEGQSATLKNVLADQAVLAGIGNAYSDEILHAARLSPFRKAAGLDEDGIVTLHRAIRDVLSDAVDRAAAVDPAALKGDKRERMRVHGRTGEPCLVCGDVIREVSYSSRSFQYCPTCQTGGRVHADRRMSRLLR
jgi:formamidopyrimidine-DNA glycosylase